MSCVILIWILCKLFSSACRVPPPSLPAPRHDVTHSFFTRLLLTQIFSFSRLTVYNIFDSNNTSDDTRTRSKTTKYFNVLIRKKNVSTNFYFNFWPGTFSTAAENRCNIFWNFVYLCQFIRDYTINIVYIFRIFAYI